MNHNDKEHFQLQTQNFKVAIVHDWMFSRRGGERVLEQILNLFPQADFYYLFGKPKEVLKLKHAKSHQKIADFIRMIILKNHGGIWLDASLYLNIPLDWIHWYQITNQSEYVGYKIRSCGVRHKRNNKIPIVENWFMACVPNSKFISGSFL